MSNETVDICSIRLKQESDELKGANMRLYRIESASSDHSKKWSALLTPDRSPYDVGAYRVELQFSKDYPFKAPKVKFLTEVYHPNVDTNGEINFPMLSNENWKPSIKIDHVLSALAELLCAPQLDCPLRAELAELYVKDATTYDKNASEFCKRYAIKHPKN